MSAAAKTPCSSSHIRGNHGITRSATIHRRSRRQAAGGCVATGELCGVRIEPAPGGRAGPDIPCGLRRGLHANGVKAELAESVISAWGRMEGGMHGIAGAGMIEREAEQARWSEGSRRRRPRHARRRQRLQISNRSRRRRLGKRLLGRDLRLAQAERIVRGVLLSAGGRARRHHPGDGPPEPIRSGLRYRHAAAAPARISRIRA